MTEPRGSTAELTSCDTEPIHIPGNIQPHGVLLVARPDTWQITHVSRNTEKIIGLPPARLIGHQLFQCLGRETSHALTNALTTSLGPSLPGRTFDTAVGPGLSCDSTIHTHDDRVLIEFEPSLDQQNEALPVLLVRAMLTRMQAANSITGICEAAVEQLRALIGFDRVMVYRFLHDGAGSVIAEKKRTEAASFLGHHYPASDIPEQARALYTKNWLRLIADVDAVPVPIMSATQADARPVDLSYCSLRSVSPIHIEYLKNMNVAASVSISIVVAGKLWGMIACHHAFPRLLTSETRVAAELFGQAFSLQLQAIERLDATEVLRVARSRLDRLLVEFPSDGSLFDSLSLRLAELMKVLPCDGVGLWINGVWRGIGVVPPENAISELATYLAMTAGREVFATHKLSEGLASAAAYADQVSGVLAIPLSRMPGDYLVYFRREFIHTIDWAGKPDKAVDRTGPELRLSPRKSFEIWKQEIRATSKVWDPPDKLAAEALRISLLEIVLRFTEVVVEQKVKATAQQRVFVAELNHRVKNALALVSALVRQSRGAHSNIALFVADLEARILALAKAHDQANAQGVLDLRVLLESELAPFDDDAHQRVLVVGPAFALESHSFAVLALVFHELTTNAAKHGALSVSRGRVEVRWDIDPDGTCALTWRETQGPVVIPPEKSGFGTKLILHQIPFELGGTVDMFYNAAGLQVDMRFLLSTGTDVIGRPDTEMDLLPRPKRAPTILADRTVLVVEDSLLVAFETEERLRAAGAAHVAVCSTIAKTFEILQTLTPDVAVLDINLKSGTSMPVADALAASGVPFVFATGYGTGREIPSRFKDVPLMTKPLSVASLTKAIERAFAQKKAAGTPRS